MSGGLPLQHLEKQYNLKVDVCQNMRTAFAVLFYYTCFVLHCFEGFGIFSSYKLSSDISVMLFLL